MEDQSAFKVIDLDVLDFTFGGDAFGRMEDGKPVFVPFSMPGEKVRVRIPVEKKDYCIGELVEILAPSPRRVTARCRHFTVCGGCHYQHLSYEYQLVVKQKIVTDQLRRIGKIENPPVDPVIPSPEQWNYRSTMQFHISPNGKLGFRDTGGGRILEIQECHLPVTELNELWPKLDIEPASGVSKLLLREGTDGELLAGLESEGDTPPEFNVDFPLSVHFLGKDQDYLMAGDAYNLMHLNGVDFVVSPRSFFQVNLPQAEAMVRFVLENCTLTTSTGVLDLYCGAGLFSAFLAPKVKELTGVEFSESACNDFATNLDACDNVSLYMGKVEEIVPHLDIQPDLVIVDPPRAGLDKKVVEYLVKRAPAQLVYVSCDPSTLARDCRRLIEGGFVIDKVQPFDLFPQTYHVETIVIFHTKSGI